MREVFLNNLPTKDVVGRKVIDWFKSIGYKVEFAYDDIVGEIEILDYQKEGQYLFIKYDDKEFKIKTHNMQKGYIGRIINRFSKDFKVEIGKIFEDNKRDLIITDREYRKVTHKPDKKGRVYVQNKKWYKYKCNKCEYEGWVEEVSLLGKNTGCSCCSGKTAVLGINTIWDTDRWMCDLGVSEEDAKKYRKSSGKKITIKCPNCGRGKEVELYVVYLMKSIGCVCGDGFSYPEKFINDMLVQLNIKFEIQYNPDYLKRKEGNKYSRKYSDFYLPNYNLIIETDGGLGHEGGKTYNKSNKSLEELIECDKWKDEQHLKHGIKTIRIDCMKSNVEYIKNSVLKSELTNIFDLSKIDWLKCEKFALKNIVKEVCDYWNNKEEWETTQTIANNNKWGVKTRPTIANYLKKGNLLGWCNYVGEGERGKHLQNRSWTNKTVEIYKGDHCLGLFKSISELESKSLSLFGVRLLSSAISMVSNGKWEKYKGFTFKYIEDNKQMSA